MSKQEVPPLSSELGEDFFKETSAFLHRLADEIMRTDDTFKATKAVRLRWVANLVEKARETLPQSSPNVDGLWVQEAKTYIRDTLLRGRRFAWRDYDRVAQMGVRLLGCDPVDELFEVKPDGK